MQPPFSVNSKPYIPGISLSPHLPCQVAELPPPDLLASDEEKLIHLLKQKGAQFPDSLTLTPEKSNEIFSWLNQKYFKGNYQSLNELLRFILNNFPSAKAVYLNGSGVFPFLHQKLDRYAQAYLSEEEYRRFNHLFKLSRAKPGDFDFKIICDENSQDQLSGRLLFLMEELTKEGVPFQDKSNDRKTTDQLLLRTLRLTVNVCPAVSLPYTEPDDEIQPELVFTVRTPYDRIFTHELEIDLTPLILESRQQLTVRMPCEHSFEDLISGRMSLAIENCIDEEPFLRIVMMRCLGNELNSPEQEEKAYQAFSERYNPKLHIKSHLKKHFIGNALMQAVYLYNMAQALLKKLPRGNLDWSLPLNKILPDSLPPLLKPLFQESEVPFPNRLAFFDFLLLSSKPFEKSPERHYTAWRTFIPCKHYRAALMTSTPLKQCLPHIEPYLNSQTFEAMASQFHFASRPNDDLFEEADSYEPLIRPLLESQHSSLRFIGMQLAFMILRKTGKRLYGNQEIIRFLENVKNLSNEERLAAVLQLGSPRLLEAAESGLEWVDTLLESEDEQEVRLAIQMDRNRAAEHLNMIAKRHPLITLPFIENTNTDLFYQVWSQIQALPLGTERQIALFQLAQKQLEHPEQLDTCDPLFKSQFLAVLKENGLYAQAILLDKNGASSLDELKSALKGTDLNTAIALIEKFLTTGRSKEELKTVQTLLPREGKQKKFKAIFTSIFRQLVVDDRLAAVKFLKSRTAAFNQEELQSFIRPIFNGISTGDEQLLKELFALFPDVERTSPLALSLYSRLDIERCLQNRELVKMMTPSDLQELLSVHLHALLEKPADCASIEKKLNEQKLCAKLPKPLKELFQESLEVPFESRHAFYRFLKSGQIPDLSLIQPYCETYAFALLAAAVPLETIENIESCKLLIHSWIKSQRPPLRLLGMRLALLYQKKSGEKLYPLESVGRFIDDAILLPKTERLAALTPLGCIRLNEAVESGSDWLTVLAKSELEEEVRWAVVHSKKKALQYLQTISRNHPLLAVELCNHSSLPTGQFWMVWDVLWSLKPGTLRQKALQQLAMKGVEIGEILKHDPSAQLEQLSGLLGEIGMEREAVVLCGEKTLTLEQLKLGLAGNESLDTRVVLMRKFLNGPQSKDALKEVESFLPTSFKKKKHSELLKHYYHRLAQADLEEAQTVLRSKRDTLLEGEWKALLSLLLDQVIDSKNEKLFFKLYHEYKEKKLFSTYALKFYCPKENMDALEIQKKITRYRKNSTLERLMTPADFAELWNQLLGTLFAKQSDIQDLEATIKLAKIYRDMILEHCFKEGLPSALVGWIDAIVKITEKMYEHENPPPGSIFNAFMMLQTELFLDLPDPHVSNDSELGSRKKTDHRLFFAFIQRYLNHPWNSQTAKKQMLLLTLKFIQKHLGFKHNKWSESLSTAIEKIIEGCAKILTTDLQLTDTLTVTLGAKLLEDIHLKGKDLFSKRKLPYSLVKLHFYLVTLSTKRPHKIEDERSEQAIKELLALSSTQNTIHPLLMGFHLLFYVIDNDKYRDKVDFATTFENLLAKFITAEDQNNGHQILIHELIALFNKYPHLAKLRQALSQMMYSLVQKSLIQANSVSFLNVTESNISSIVPFLNRFYASVVMIMELFQVPGILNGKQFIILFKIAKNTLFSVYSRLQVPQSLLLLKNALEEYLVKVPDLERPEVEEILRELEAILGKCDSSHNLIMNLLNTGLDDALNQSETPEN